MGWLSLGKDREREQGKDILMETVIMGLERNLVLGELPGNHKGDPG